MCAPKRVSSVQILCHIISPVGLSSFYLRFGLLICVFTLVFIYSILSFMFTLFYFVFSCSVITQLHQALPAKKEIFYIWRVHISFNFFYRCTLTHTHARARMYFYAHLTENMTIQFKSRLALIKCNLSLTTMSAKSSKCGVSHEARGWEHQRLITLITFYQKSTKSFDDMIFTNSSCKNFEKTSKINVSK